jgi:hypothetical protein
MDIRACAGRAIPLPGTPPFPLLPLVSPTGRGSSAAHPQSEEETMAAPKFIEIDGRRYVWRELGLRRREQVAAAAKVAQRFCSR